MISLMQQWWKLALSASEIALSAPQVVQARTARLTTAPGLASARNRREAVRMVSEKWDAGLAGQAAMWQAGWRMQQQMLNDFWALALGGRSLRGAAKRIGRRNALASLAMANRSLAPVRRRVRSNARRLRTAK
jgi:hypothetical protein